MLWLCIVFISLQRLPVCLTLRQKRPRFDRFLLSRHFCPQLQLEKSKGEILGVVIVESGWGSILPTVILANMMNGGPAARSGKLSIGDQIMSINNTSLVGLPLATCQGIIKVPRPSRAQRPCVHSTQGLCAEERRECKDEPSVCVSQKGLKNQVQVKMNIVSCPPVTTVLIKRPDLKYQLGFSVQNGIVSVILHQNPF